MPEQVIVSSQQMRELLDLSRIFNATIDLTELLPQVVVAVTKLLGCERATVYFHDAETDELWTQIALHNKPIRLHRSRGIAGFAFNSGQALRVDNAYEDSRFDPTNDQQTGYRTRDILAVPMFDLNQKPVGVLQAVNSHDGFGDHDLHLLQLIADQAAVSVQRDRLNQQVLKSVELRREMKLAANIQLEQLPQHLPKVGTLDCYGWSQPASVTGGDCYDLWEMDDGRLGILLADSAGHGLPAAMVVTQARTLIRALSNDLPSPAQVLTRVNKHLASELSPHRFVTAVLAYLSADGQLEMASAGHGPSLLKRSPKHDFDQLAGTGLPLVVDADLPVRDYESTQILPGGELVLLSDGIFEAPSKTGEMLGIERVILSLHSQLEQPSHEQVQHLRLLTRTWQGHDNPKDDQTIVIVKRQN